MNNSIPNLVYGFNNPLSKMAPAPIISDKFPTTANKANIGQIWVNTVQNSALILTSITNNEANWQPFSGSAAFTSLTVTPGPISLTGLTDINISGSDDTLIGNTGIGAGSITMGGQDISISSRNDITIDAINNFTLNGPIIINFNNTENTTIGNSDGDVSIFASLMTLGSAIAPGDINMDGNTVNINSASDGLLNLGNTVGGTVVTGDLDITTGNVTLNTAGSSFTLPGPVNIISGAGAPANGLALHVGDLYINTTAASTTTRLYIATAVGSWANFTASA